MKKRIQKIIICLIIITMYFTYFAQYSMASTSLSEYSDEKFSIKKLSTHVPQGLCKITISSTTYRLITAYNSSNGSILEVYSSNGTYIGSLYLKNSNGNLIKGHVGGITTCKSWIIIVSTGKVYIFSKSNLKTAIDKIYYTSYLTATSEVDYATETYGNASFCTTDIDNSIWIGNYSKYTTSHAYRFILNDSTGTLSYSNTKMSIPSRIQGMAFTQNGKYVAFSQSNGSNGSYVYLYRVCRTSNNQILLVYYKSKCQTVYCGIEEIYFTSNNNLYAVFESAAVGYSHTPKSSSSYKTSSYVRLLKTSTYTS